MGVTTYALLLAFAAYGGFRAIAYSDVSGAAELAVAGLAATLLERDDRRMKAALALVTAGLLAVAAARVPSSIPAVIAASVLAFGFRERTREGNSEALREVTDNVREAFFILSADFSTVLYASPAFVGIWHRTGSDLGSSGADWRSTIHPLDRARMEYACEQAAADEEPLDEEFRVIRPDETERWVWVRAFPIRDADGAVRRNAGIAEDVTSRKEAEIELAIARDQEMSIGARIQKRLLLEEPDISTPGFEIGALSLPSQRIDGDFYNFFSFEPNTVDLLIGDVMGKGIPAALVGAGAKSTFLKAKVNLLLGSRSSIPKPVDIVREAHHHLVEELIGLENFLTLHYLRLDGRTRELQFVDCGNTPLVLYRSRTDSCWTIKGSNVPLGFLRNEQYEQFGVPLDPGDLLLCYSDGITEAENPDEGPFGEDRLLHFVRAHHGSAPVDLVQSLTEVLQTYVGGAGFRDDVTAVAVRVTGFAGESAGSTHTFAATFAELGSLRGFVRHEISRAYPSLSAPELEDSLVLAANEIFSNIVEHGAGNAEGIPVEISTRGDTMYLQMQYNGEEFDWVGHRNPEIEKMEERGYGMYIIEQLADSVVYCRDQRGANVVWLSKKIGVPSLQ